MKKIISLDFEFNEVSHEKGAVKPKYINMEIVQIGAVMLDENMNIIKEFKTFVKPEFGMITKKCTRLTGIKQSDVHIAGTFETEIARFLNWIGELISDTVIYSWSSSDFYQMKNECMEKGIKEKRLNVLFANWVDFQKDFGNLLGLTWQVSLKNAMQSMDMTFVGNAHDALYDAMNTASLIQLTHDKAVFDKKADAIRSLFMPKEESMQTLGDVFSSDLLACLA